MSGKANRQGRAVDNGDRGVARLEAAYRRYAAYVYALCLRLLVDARAAEDATVAVFVRLGRVLTGSLDESRMLERMRQFSIEEAVTRLRLRDHMLADKTPALRVTPPARARAPASPVPPALDQNLLGALVAQLSDLLRVVFVLSDQEGLSETAIAADLQITEADVRRLVHSARLELRRLWLTPT